MKHCWEGIKVLALHLAFSDINPLGEGEPLATSLWGCKFSLFWHWPSKKVGAFCQSLERVDVSSQFPSGPLLAWVGWATVFLCLFVFNGVWLNRRAITQKFSALLGCLFLVLWLERAGLCWGFFSLQLLQFQVIGIFSPKSEIHEAIWKPRTSPLCSALGPEVPAGLFLLYTFQSLLTFVLCTMFRVLTVFP